MAEILVIAKGGHPIIGEVSEWVRRSQLAVEEMQVEQGRLDDVFRELTLPGPGRA
jgi:hypothetical protein